MKIDVLASEPHYLEHMLPIFDALPDRLKGTIHPLRFPESTLRPPMGRAAMVAGWQDVVGLRGQCPMIYVEHGAGQSYADVGFHPSYSRSGGVRHQGVIGFISPSHDVAKRWLSAPAKAVGCPKMDSWLGTPPPKQPAVCFAWHWECEVVPEARSAWPHYRARMGQIIGLYSAMGFQVYVHEHPKWRGRLIDEWSNDHDVPVLQYASEVFEKASILFVDNSSLATEFMLLNRPVVFMNAPWYRRDVQHGGRFWDWVAGHVMVNGPDDLLAMNPWDLVHEVDATAAACEMTTRQVYAFRDGTSSQRAANFITEVLEARA